MAATVEGVFRIIDRASGPMRRMEQQAIRTDAAIKRLGDDLDKVGGRQQLRQMESTERSLRNIDRTSQQTFQRSARDTDRFSRSMRGAGRETEAFHSRLIKVGASLLSIQKIIGVLKIPAMGTAVGVAAQAIGALTANVVSLLPKLADLGGVVGAMPAAFAGMGLAMATVKLAFSDLTKAMGGNEKAMAKLTPEAKRFITTLKEYQPVVQEIRRSAQQGLFPGLDYALRRLQRGVPLARQLVGQMGTALGGLAGRAAERFTTPDFLRDLGVLGRQGILIVNRLGQSLLNLVDAMRHIGVAARPFTRWLADTILGFSKWAASAAEAGRVSGRLGQWFERSRRSLTLFGHILRDIWFILRDVGQAARAVGDTMWAGAERAVRGWRRWTSSVGGQLAMTRMFIQTRDVLGEVMKLLGDVGAALFRMAQQPGLADTIARLRPLIPALEQLLNTFVTTFATNLARLLPAIVSISELLVASTGPLNIFLGLVAQVATALANLINSVPALRSGFIAIFSVVAIGLFVRRIVGATYAMFGLTRATQGAAIATQELNMAQAGGAAGAVSRGAGAASLLGFGGGRAAGGLGARISGSRLGMSTLGTRVGLGGLAARGAIAGRLGRFVAPGTAGETAALRAMSIGSRVAPWAARGARLASPIGWGTLIGSTALSMIPGVPRGVQSYASAIGAGAGIGALAGSVVPGLGTGTGALVGAGLGAGYAFLSRRRRPSPADQAQRSLGAYQGILQGMGGDDPTYRQLRAQVAFLQRGVRDYAHAQSESGRAVLASLQQELATRKQVLGTQRQQRVEAARVEAHRLLPQFGREFNFLRGRVGTEKAMQMTTTDILERMNKLPEAGRAIVGRAALVWAQEAAKQNPKLRGQYERLREGVEDSFRKLGRNVQIFHNRILTGTEAQWKAISKAMQTPLEQAREKISQQFTFIQQEAVAALQAMGYSRTAASMIVTNMEGGQSFSKARQQQQITAHHHGMPGRARGGRIPGVGLHDTVPVGGRAMAAPGELIVNRHTESRVNRALARHGTSLGREVGRERRGHAMPSDDDDDILSDKRFQRGGRISKLEAAVREANRIDAMRLTYVLGGGHVTPAPASGPFDCSSATSRVLQAAGYNVPTMVSGGFMNWGEPGPGAISVLANPGHVYMVMNGRAWGTSRSNPGGGPGWVDGYTFRRGFTVRHAPGAGGGAVGDFAGAGTGAVPQIGELGIPSLGLGGVGGAVSLGVGRMLAGGMRARVNRRLAAQAGLAGATAGSAGVTGGAARTLAHRMMLSAGWGEGQWGPLNKLWTKESGFNPQARNAQSGAFGIPQALPASKLGPAGMAGDARAQIAWGLNYIRDRYRSPAAAWAHSQAHNWYETGGRVGWGGWNQAGGQFRVSRPTLFGAGDGPGAETVRISRSGMDTRTGPLVGRMVIHNHRPGDVQRAIEREVQQAFANLARTIDRIPMEGDEEVSA